MPSITQGSRPISGVYVRGRLATGLYVGQQAIWPTEILGSSNLGAGRFGFGGRGLLAGTGNNLHVAPRTFAFSGRPLQSAISRALHVDMARGATVLTGRSAGIAASAKPPLHAGALAVGASPLSVISGHVIPAITGSLHFTGQPLPKISGNEVAAYLSPGTLQFAAVNVAFAAGAVRAIGAGGFTFAGTAPSVGTGSALLATLAPSALALTGSMPSIGAATEVSIGADAMAFTGAVLYPPAHVVVNVTPSALSMWGHYTEVDTSPFALRRVGSRSTIGVTTGGSTNVLLPTGSSEGDLALIATQGPLSGGDSPPVGAVTVENQQLALYRYMLTESDVLNGYVTMQVSSNAPIIAEVFHDADSVLDAVGTYASSTVTYPASTTVTFAGLTTARTGAEPVAFLAATNAGSLNISTPNPATWGIDAWNVGLATGAQSQGIGIMRAPAQMPGSVTDATWGYNYAVASGTSTRATLMLAVRPSIVNVFAGLSPGSLAIPGEALTVPWTYPDVNLSLAPGTLALSDAALVEPMDVPTVTFVGSGVVYNGQNEANGSSTQLPLPAGTQAGDYMFVNFGMNFLDPNDMPVVPQDSQLLHTVGEWFSLTAYWIPIIPLDVANGYITIDPRRPCSFPYVVYRGADRYLQAVGDIVTPDPNVAQNGTLLVPGLPAQQASGAAIIALTTTDAVNSEVISGQGAWGVSADAPWQAECAIDALIQVGGGGLRSAVLWSALEVGASVPDTTVYESVWSQYSDSTAAQMFAIRANQRNVTLSMGADSVAFSPVELAPTASGAVSADCLPGALTLTFEPMVFGSLAWLLVPAPSPDVGVYMNNTSGGNLTSLVGLYPDSTQPDDSLLVTILTYGNGSTNNGLSFTEPDGAVPVVNTEGGTASGVNPAYGFILTQYVIPHAGVSGSGQMTIPCSVSGAYYSSVMVTVARVAAPYQYVSGAAHAWGAAPAGSGGVASSITVTGAASSASDGVALSLATAPVSSPSSVGVDGFTVLTPDPGSTLDNSAVQGSFYDLLPSAGAFSVTGTFNAYSGGSYTSMGLVTVVPFVPVAYIATNIELPATSPGAPFNGTLQASNRLGASGTLSVTPPAGVVLGTPSTADSITSWPFSGTAGASSETLTFSITNGTQTATASATLDVVTPIATVGVGAVAFVGATLPPFTSAAGTGVSIAIGAGALAIAGQTLVEDIGAAAPVVDDFGHGSAIANYTISTQGAAGGTGTVVGENLVLDTADSVINSVAATRSGSGWHSIEVNVADVSSAGAYKYFDICLGHGPIVAYGSPGNTNWWYTVLKDCYFIRLTAASNLMVSKSVGGTGSNLSGTLTFSSISFTPHRFKLSVSDAGVIVASIDGTQIFTITDTSVSPAGMIAMVAQGQYTNGDGGTVDIDKITLDTNP